MFLRYKGTSKMKQLLQITLRYSLCITSPKSGRLYKDSVCLYSLYSLLLFSLFTHCISYFTFIYYCIPYYYCFPYLLLYFLFMIVSLVYYCIPYLLLNSLYIIVFSLFIIVSIYYYITYFFWLCIVFEFIIYYCISYLLLYSLFIIVHLIYYCIHCFTLYDVINSLVL